MRHPRGLVSFSAIGNGSKIRRIGFRKNSVVRNEANQIVVRPFPERHYSAERHVPSDANRRLGKLMRTRVAMKNSCNTARPCLENHRARVILRIASVNDDGNAHLPRNSKLFSESPSLLPPRRIVVVVIQAAFAYRYRTCRAELLQFIHVAHAVKSGRVMRMNSSCEPHEARVLVGDNHRCASGAEDIPGAASGADTDNRCGSRIPCAIDYLAAVACERFVGEVRVAVDEPLETPSFRGHFLSIQSNTGLAT
jgi:hypothetical protein